ncbi:MarC family protein [Methylobacterium sp. WL120]|uniref:MarC family protein n=1 Tax=Methylobacterium sp. WL120 TaxID=2603887 RepID=UPI0011C7E9A5|nr:MarC family protein [Methylobacterium sp. WL120]TXM68124.1 MarC family protein [Methylobacterium sp. WL120]
MSVEAAIQQFLLALSSLFSIVNPLGGALIFAQVTAGHSHDDRVWLAGRIGGYALLIMLAALWAGAPILNFFGVSLGALRIAGGLVVGASAWGLLNRPEAREARKQAEVSSTTGQGATAQAANQGAAAQAASQEATAQAANQEATAQPAKAASVKTVEPTPADGQKSVDPLSEIAFFPLTLPFTTGPGTIAVAITLGSNRPALMADRLGFYVGVSLAALGVAATVALIYASADRVVSLLGPIGARVLGRLFAFLLLCVGTQITINGVIDVFGPLLAAR